MPTAKNAKTQNNDSLEQKLWKATDKLRKNIDAAEYKHLAKVGFDLEGMT
ncbi:hypothetical protein [Leptolyngbya sp. CCY15150]|nr:hypothetical protein [Leptolyngbya sp. CCY15150]